MRQFQSASGRTWSVQLDRDVLRFFSPGLTCELADWPDDWEQLPEPQLLQLLDKALTVWVTTART